MGVCLMTKYVRIVEGSPVEVTRRQIRNAFPDVSFPASFPPEILAQYNAFPLVDDRPAFDPLLQTLTVGGIIETAGPTYTREYTVTNKTEAELRADAAQAASDVLDSLDDGVVQAIIASLDAVWELVDAVAPSALPQTKGELRQRARDILIAREEARRGL